MWGKKISDPNGPEGPPAAVEGLRLLDIETVLEGDKVLVEITGETAAGGVPFKGYEMHVGRTTGSSQPLLKLCNGNQDCALSADGRIACCHVHGLIPSRRPRRHS